MEDGDDDGGVDVNGDRLHDNAPVAAVVPPPTPPTVKIEDVKLEDSGLFNPLELNNADDADARRMLGRNVDVNDAETVFTMPPVTIFMQLAADGDLVDRTRGVGDLLELTDVINIADAAVVAVTAAVVDTIV